MPVGKARILPNLTLAAVASWREMVFSATAQAKSDKKTLEPATRLSASGDIPLGLPTAFAGCEERATDATSKWR